MAETDLSAFLRRLRRTAAARGLVERSDRQLVEWALARHDDAAFQAIVQRHGPMVYRVCRRALQHPQDAEDAFQATFLLLAQKLGTLRRQGSLASWLHGVAHRVALKAQARAAVRRRHEQQAATPDALPPDDGTWREVRAALDRELSRLPDRWRLPLILCYLEGRTQDEAAGQLGWSKSTLRRRLRAARNALGRRLKGRGIAWSAGLSAVLVSDCLSSAAPAPWLLASTAAAGAGVAAGKTVAAAAPAGVAALTEGALKVMPVTRLKIATAVVLVVALIGCGWAVVSVLTPKAGATNRVEKKAEEPDKPMSPSRALKGEYKFLSLSLSRDGRSLATVTRDPDNEPGDVGAKNAVRVWDVRSGSVRCTLAEDLVKERYYTTYAGVGLSPDGKTVAAPAGGQFDGELSLWLILWDAETGKITQKLKHGTEVRALAFSPDGKTVASGTGCGGAEADVETVKLWDVKTGKLLRSLKTRDLEADKIAFAPDGKLLAAVHDPVLDHSQGSAEVTLWDAAEGKWSQALPESDGIEIIAFAPDGKKLLGAARTKLLVWDVVTHKTIRKSELKTTEERSALAFSPDGTALAVADKHDVALYDVKAAMRTKTLRGGEGLIGTLSFSPDGNTLAGGSSDRTIYLWDLDRGRERKK
jgi:RNA polymerase sigma factor (sigma-70 family)